MNRAVAITIRRAGACLVALVIAVAASISAAPVAQAVPPKPVISSPAEGTVIAQAGTVTISGTLVQPTPPVYWVSLAVDGIWLCFNTVSGSSWSVNCNLPAGVHNLSALFVDTDDDEGAESDPVTVYVGVQPEPVVTSPGEGDVVDTSTPTFTGTVSSPSTADVSVQVDGTEVCTAPGSASTWSCTPTTPLPQGSHSVTAIASSAAGTSGASSAVNFQVALAPPSPLITAPAAGATLTSLTPTFQGTAEANADITVAEGADICSTTADAAGDWACTATQALSAGQHTVSVTATNAMGSTSEPTNVTFVIQPAAPTVPTTPASSSAATASAPASGASSTTDTATTASDDLADTGGPSPVVGLTLLCAGIVLLGATVTLRRRLCG